MLRVLVFYPVVFEEDYCAVQDLKAQWLVPDHHYQDIFGYYCWETVPSFCWVREDVSAEMVRLAGWTRDCHNICGQCQGRGHWSPLAWGSRGRGG